MFIQFGADIPNNLLPKPTRQIGVDVLCNGIKNKKAQKNHHHADHGIVITYRNIMVKRILYKNGPYGR
jgi:hypothetical protein